MSISQKSKNIIKAAVVVVSLVAFAQYLLPDVNSPEFKVFVQDRGTLGPFIILSYIITAHIIPLSIIGFVFKDFNFNSKGSLVVWAGIILFIGGASALYFKKHLSKKVV